MKKRKDKEGKSLDKMMEDEEEEEEEEENEEDGTYILIMFKALLFNFSHFVSVLLICLSVSFPCFPSVSFFYNKKASSPSYLSSPLSFFIILTGKTQVGSKKEIDGYEEESDDEAGEEADVDNGKENIGSDSDSDSDEKNKNKKKTDSDDDSDEDAAPQKSSSAKSVSATASSSSSSSSSSNFKTPAKKSSRVSFGTGLVGMSSHATTPFSKSSLGLGGEVGFDEEEGWVEMLLSYPATSRRLLMVQLGTCCTPVCLYVRTCVCTYVRM